MSIRNPLIFNGLQQHIFNLFKIHHLTSALSLLYIVGSLHFFIAFKERKTYNGIKNSTTFQQFTNRMVEKR